MNQTYSQKQEELFDSLSHDWWNPKGSFLLLHTMNPLRIEFIIKQIGSLEGIKVLDIGCGGGILSEPLARLGALVTGIDFSKEAIHVAKTRASDQNLNIQYLHVQPHWMEKNDYFEGYDLVIASEIIEHVENPSVFMEQCLGFLNPLKNKGLILSTLNRTPSSYLGAILGAEYILKWVPIATHSWDQFLKPSEIEQFTQSYNQKNNTHYQWNKISGLKLNPLSKKWSFSNNISINYIGHITQN